MSNSSVDILNSVAGAFKGFKEARPGRRSSWMGPGRYFVRLERFKLFQSETDLKTGFMSELVIVKVLNPEEEDPTKAPEHRAGDETTVSFWIKSNTGWQGDLKAFLGCAMNIEDPEEITLDEVKMCVDDDQPLAGTIMEVYAWKKPMSKKPGQYFTVVEWKRVVPALELAEVLTEAEKRRFFHGDLLERMIALEAAA